MLFCLIASITLRRHRSNLAPSFRPIMMNEIMILEFRIAQIRHRPYQTKAPKDALDKRVITGWLNTALANEVTTKKNVCHGGRIVIDRVWPMNLVLAYPYADNTQVRLAVFPNTPNIIITCHFISFPHSPWYINF